MHTYSLKANRPKNRSKLARIGRAITAKKKQFSLKVKRNHAKKKLTKSLAKARRARSR